MLNLKKLDRFRKIQYSNIHHENKVQKINDALYNKTVILTLMQKKKILETFLKLHKLSI